MSDFLKEASEWIAKPEDERDLRKGAELVLRITRNRIMYNDMMSRPERYAKHIEYQVQKWINRKTAAISHEQVEVMEAKAEMLMEAVEHHVAAAEEEKKDDDKGKDKAERPMLVGKREDHDKLPPEIQALYLENFSLIQRMRECHLQVRNATGPTQACIDSDKWAFLKELIDLDKRLHANWQLYDTYVVGTPATPVPAAKTAEPTDSAEVKDESKKSLQLVKMNLGKYKKNPNEPLKKRILEWYEKIINPTDALKQQLVEIGILDEA